MPRRPQTRRLDDASAILASAGRLSMSSFLGKKLFVSLSNLLCGEPDPVSPREVERQDHSPASNTGPEGLPRRKPSLDLSRRDENALGRLNALQKTAPASPATPAPDRFARDFERCFVSTLSADASPRVRAEQQGFLECLRRIDFERHGPETDCGMTAGSICQSLTGFHPDGLRFRRPDGEGAELIAELKKSQPPDHRMVYYVDLPGILHELAIARCGDQALVLQSFVDTYSLNDWMEGKKAELADNPWLPAKGSHATSDIADLLDACQERLKASDSKEMQRLFSPDALGLRRAESRMGSPRGLDAAWRSFPMKDRSSAA